MTRSKAGKGYHSAREALLLNGRFVLSQVRHTSVRCRCTNSILMPVMLLDVRFCSTCCVDLPCPIAPGRSCRCWQAVEACANMPPTCSHGSRCWPCITLDLDCHWARTKPICSLSCNLSVAVFCLSAFVAVCVWCCRCLRTRSAPVVPLTPRARARQASLWGPSARSCRQR